MKKFIWEGRKGTLDDPEWTKKSEKEFDNKAECFNDMKKAWAEALCEIIDGETSTSLRSSISSKRLGAYIYGVNITFNLKEIDVDDENVK